MIICVGNGVKSRKRSPLIRAGFHFHRYPRFNRSVLSPAETKEGVRGDISTDSTRRTASVRYMSRLQLDWGSMESSNHMIPSLSPPTWMTQGRFRFLRELVEASFIEETWAFRGRLASCPGREQGAMVPFLPHDDGFNTRENTVMV